MKNMLLLALSMNVIAQASSTCVQALSLSQIKAAADSMDTLMQPIYAKHLADVVRKYKIDEATLLGKFNLIKARIQGVPLEKIVNDLAREEILCSGKFTDLQIRLLHLQNLLDEMMEMIRKNKCVEIFTKEEIQKFNISGIDADQAAEKMLTNETLLSKATRFYDRYEKIKRAKKNLGKELNDATKKQYASLDNQTQLLFAQLRDLIRSVFIPSAA